MIEDIVRDFLVGDKNYWKRQFNKVVNQINNYEPKKSIDKYFGEETETIYMLFFAENMMLSLYPPTAPRVIWNVYFRNLYLYLVEKCDDDIY